MATDLGKVLARGFAVHLVRWGGVRPETAKYVCGLNDDDWRYVERALSGTDDEPIEDRVPWAILLEESQPVITLLHGHVCIPDVCPDWHSDEFAQRFIAGFNVVERLTSALERTEANFVRAVRGQPVRDMAETLAENERALTRARTVLRSGNVSD